MAGLLTTLQNFLTGLAGAIGVDPVYFIFVAGITLWLISVGATPGGFASKLKAVAVKTRMSWVILLLVMILTQFTILTLKTQSNIPPTRYFFLQTISAIFSGVMLKQKYDEIFAPGDY